jgi:hypothetical protein
MNKVNRAAAGHLTKSGPLVLEQTPRVRESLSRAERQRNSFNKLQPVTLNWGKKS